MNTTLLIIFLIPLLITLFAFLIPLILGIVLLKKNKVVPGQQTNWKRILGFVCIVVSVIIFIKIIPIIFIAILAGMGMGAAG
jgi:phosphatidylglycerophosphate synthase